MNAHAVTDLGRDEEECMFAVLLLLPFLSYVPRSLFLPNFPPLLVPLLSSTSFFPPG